MRVTFCIHTPAQVHLFRNVITELLAKGHEIEVLAREYGSTLVLLDAFGLDYEVYARHSDGHKYTKGLQLFRYVLGEYRLSRRFRPDIIVGIGTIEPIVARVLRKPCILFNDSERTPFQHRINRLFANVIITPSCFDAELGKKQLRIPGYKEFAYLHPDYFRPDPSILTELGLSSGEKYVVLRFNAFDAFHDIGKRGFATESRLQLARELSRYARVFISPEGALPVALEQYRLPVAKDRIHQVLYYAELLVTDTQTMATEAAVLGTPAVRCNNWVGPDDMGIFKELEYHYDLMYSVEKPEDAIRKAVQLITKPDLKGIWATKRHNLLSDKINVARFLADFIEGYPGSMHEQREKLNKAAP